MEMKKIVVFGPGPQFKGGIANFTVSLAKSLESEGAEVTIVSWIQQYPAIIPRDFIDRSSKSDLLEGSKIKVHYLCNYNNPFSWNSTAKFIAELKPDKVIFQWAIAIQGLPMGWISKKIKAFSPATEILFDVHNVVQKETGSLDKKLTRYALKSADSFIMHGQITIDEFKAFLPELAVDVSLDGTRSKANKTILKLYHPIYDIFKPNPRLPIAQLKKELGLGEKVFLFFGFIRKYKGLHYAIESFAKIAKSHPEASLLIVGESFWDTVDKKNWLVRIKSALFRLLKSIFIRSKDQEKDYRPLELIQQLGLENRVVVVNRFVPNEEVNRYFQLSNAVVNFYEYATPSGVESIAYNFHKPILATRVGHFAHAIVDGENGYLAEAADVESMASTLERFLKHPIPESNVKTYADQLSWEKYARVILKQ
jgi:glycosyltransferase involved in cell wall biosynthesis